MKELNKKEEFIRDLGIFELRGLARKLGVRSPTTKKRDELIEYIIQSLEKENGTVNIGTKKGRPFKELSSINEILNTMTSGVAVDSNMNYNDCVMFAQEEKKFEEEDKMECEETECVGYARVNQHNISFLDTKTNDWVFLPFSVEGSDKISQGDKIKVIAKAKSKVNQFVSTKIVQINGIDKADYNKEAQSCQTEVISNETYAFGNKKIKQGRRNSVCLSEDLYENDDFLVLNKECNQKNIKVVVLGLNTSFEDQIYFSKFSNIENFTTKYGTSEEINFNKILDAINFVNQTTLSGHSVLLLISDVMEVVRVINSYAKNKINGNDNILKVVVTELLSLAKAFENGSATTILLGYRHIDSNNEYLQNEILRVCKEI